MNRALRQRAILIASVAILGTSAVGAIATAAIWQRGESTSTNHRGDNLSVSSAESSSHAKSLDDHETQTRIPVRVFLVGSRSSNQSMRSLTGIVQARYATEIAFRISGKVLKRHVEVGQTVTKGQLLFELDSVDYELSRKTAMANLDVAKAAVLQATAEEARLRALRGSNSVSASEYDRSLSERDIAIGRQESASRQLDLANNQLEYCRLTSDADGIITAIQAEEGQVVGIGTPVCTLARDGEMEAIVDIPENRLPSQTNIEAAAEFWSLPGVQSHCKLRELSPSADPATRTYRGRFTLIDPPATVRLGMTVKVKWSDSQSSDRIAIPATALFETGGKPAVWLIERATGSIAATAVKVDQIRDGEVIVIGGIKPGDEIVSAGVHKLDASSKVRQWEIQR